MTDHRQFFKEWRKHRGLTQQQVAEALDSSSGYVSDMENGKRRYNQDTLEQLAEVFACTTADLLSRNPLKPDPEAAVTEMFHHLGEDRQKDWLEYGRFLTQNAKKDRE